MKKYFFIAALLLGYCLQAFSQYGEARKTDSTRLDSLKRLLLLTKGTARVDLLNKIALRITYFDRDGGFTHRDDSVRYYYSKAYNEANILGYKAGIAKGLIAIAGFEPYENLPVKDESAREKDIRKGIQIAEQMNDNELLGLGYLYLSGMPSISMDFEKNVDYMKKSIDYFHKAGNILSEAEVTNWVCAAYLNTGDYEKAFDYGKMSVELSKKSKTDISTIWHEFLVQFSLDDMVDIYSAAADYESAMTYLREMDQYGQDHKGAEWDMPMLTAGLFYEMGQYDSARIYINRWIENGAHTETGKGHQAVAWSILGKIYLNSTKEYDKAITIFKNWSDTVEKYHPAGTYATTPFLISLAQTYDARKNYDSALHYAKRAVNFAQQKNQRPEMMQGFQVLSTVYHELGNNDSAYSYLVKYNTIKDSIQNKQFLLRIYNAKKDAEDEKKEAKVTLLDKDNKIKKQQLSQQAMLRNFLLVMLLVLMAAAAFIFRNLHLKRKNEQLQNGKQQAELKEHAARLEMQALRAQMNPHFIFNCLSSINSFILDNDTDTASDYLTRFSRLIRMVLTNSEKSLITLEEELKMLRLYMDMERLRFENAFDYTITYTNDVDVETLMVPPLLLQPFCENAIWHGLMHKEGKGHLTITIIKKEEYIHCIITDDGIGRSKAEELNSKSANKEKSMGLKITNERLSLFNNEEGVATAYEIEDILDSTGTVTGTKVNLKIRHKNLMEKIA
ncbi:hypothetical protein BH11BAC5_BH11BAC5_14350 [soil metagenome]